MKYLVTDNFGTMAKVDVEAFDTMAEAQVAAVEEVIEWVEEHDADNTYVLTTLQEQIEQVVAGDIAHDEDIECAGFRIEFCEEA